MKSLVLAAAMSVATACGAGKAAADIIFDGVITYTAVSDFCQFVDEGTTRRAVYYIANLGGETNEGYSALSTLTDSEGTSYRLATGRFTAQFKQVAVNTIGSSPLRYTGRLRIATSAPAIAPSIETLAITGQIENPDGDQGFPGYDCLVDFRASFTRRHQGPA